MPKKPPTKGHLQTERNRIRGLIGTIKGSQHRGPTARRRASDPPDQAKRFQQAIAGALIKSREALATGQFDSFVSWMEVQTTSQLAGITELGATSPELLREVLGSQPLPLSKEILWIVARLTPHWKRLSTFLGDVSRLEDLYWKGHWPSIARWLDDVEASYGRSLWLIEARLCLQQEFEGIESQKRVLAAQRKLGHRSLAAYVAQHISVRNEPTTDLARFRTELATRLSTLDVAESLRTFLEFRLLGASPRSELAASQTLQIAQSLSEIDLYETLVRVCQSRLVQSMLRDRGGATWAALARLQTLNDARLRSILAAPVSAVTLPQHEPLRGVRPRLRALADKPERFDLAIECAGLLASSRKSTPVDGASGKPWTRLIRSMAAALRFDSGHDAELANLAKFHANHVFIASADAWWCQFRIEIGKDRSPVTVPEPLSASTTLARLQWELPSARRWSSVLQLLNDTSRANDLQDFGRVINGIVDLRLRRDVPLSALPLRAGLATARWRELKPHRASLSLPIALHLCWRATDSDLAATNLRYAYEEFLDSEQAASPTELVARQDKFDHAELVYFLREVCVPVVMDMSQRIQTSRAVEDLRSQVCAALRELDPANDSDYQSEIVSIVHSHSLAEGQTVVDSSRVHVDTTALLAWAARTLAGDLQRYTALVEAGVGVAESLESILRAVQSAAHAVNYLEVPDSEADFLLIELMMALRRQFLLDPQHGLDSYLSRRVRHHSMTGYVRGPVEEAKLITSRNTKNGRYAPNDFWLDKLSLDGVKRATVARFFEQFAEDFDAIVLGLKTGLFHVRSNDHPKGLFDIVTSAPMIHVARSAIQAEPTLETFCSVCFSLFWASLDPSLKEAQRHLRQETKREVVGAFQRLRASLKRELDRSRYDEASIAIQDSAEKVQRAIDQMAEWFVRREVQQTRQFYAMSRVLEISISSALASHRPFNFEIDKHVDCNVLVRPGDLVVMAEVVLTALGNVKAHAGRTSGPVVVCLTLSSSQSISLRVTNPVDRDAMSEEALTRIEEIREEIRDGSYVGRIRSEGGSGLMKIAASVKQSPQGSIDFGMRDGNFYVEVTFGFVQEAGTGLEGMVGRLVG
jgi:hypothetical protein